MKKLPLKFSSPELICFNQSLAKDLSIDVDNIPRDDLAKIFSGQKFFRVYSPSNGCAGFQFGHPVGQLGDGSAFTWEVNGYDIQLKGSGRTRFSSRGDGRSAGRILRSILSVKPCTH